MHRGAFCQFSSRWIYYYGVNKSNGKETGKTHLCAMFWLYTLPLAWPAQAKVQICIDNFYLYCEVNSLQPS